ncbi:MAG: adenosylhomocysteinase, partial [Candidatus Veblenbacteria bacterium]|nr:adenosylhomocysteinase [Candidatus Veblenbacteria bacterium]
MQVLTALAERFRRQRSFEGIRISACLHVTAETANLALALQAGGAQVSLCGSNPLSTQDDVVAALKRRKIAVFAKRGVDNRIYYQHIRACLGHPPAGGPQLTVDDGADLVTYLHTKARSLLKHVWGGTEETTTGVIRLKAMAKAKKLEYPVVAVNSALTKHLFDNRYGTGQSTIDAIMRATNILLAGKVIVVAGYGWCGRGVAMRAKGMGARVVVAEVDSTRALEALMDGYEVMPLSKVARVGEVFVTTTGNRDVVTGAHFKQMKDGAILVNAGHFDVEIDVAALKKMALWVVVIRDNLEEFTIQGNKKLYLVAEGRLANLGAAEGHPAAVMDMSFANQALSLEYLVKQHGQLKPIVYDVPVE